MQNVVPRLSMTPGHIRHTGRKGIGADQGLVDAALKGEAWLPRASSGEGDDP